MTDDPYQPPTVPGGKKQRSIGRIVAEWCAAMVVIVIVLIFLLPVHRGGREAPRRSQCKNNLKQLGLAFHNYHDIYGSFPPAYTVDENGQRLHSWRTLLLPYLDQAALYAKIDLTKPWNHPNNAEAFSTQLHAFNCPSAGGAENNRTTYMVITGEGLMFNGTQTRSIDDVIDGTSNTILVVEVPANLAAPWMEPRDIDESILQSWKKDSQLSHAGGFQMTLADGSVRFISAETGAETRHALLTINGGETVGDY